MIVYSVFGKRSPISIESNDGNLKSEKTWFLLSSNTVTTYDKAFLVFKSKFQKWDFSGIKSFYFDANFDEKSNFWMLFRKRS